MSSEEELAIDVTTTSSITGLKSELLNVRHIVVYNQIMSSIHLFLFIILLFAIIVASIRVYRHFGKKFTRLIRTSLNQYVIAADPGLRPVHI